jgi:hypothetical protein
MSCDDNVLSDYQIFLHKQMEFFVVQQEDIDDFTPDRKRRFYTALKMELIELQERGRL